VTGLCSSATAAERGVVFCCFNTGYKIMPAVFDIWMRLLLAVEGSVLWLIARATATNERLRQQARSMGSRRSG
jgi:predicted O-linked N-acetylglucosamine transferase (SPINDLY family)